MTIMKHMYPILVMLVATQARQVESAKNLRVYNGLDDDTYKYPYVVCLKTGNDMLSFILRICTGSLISETWVVTAAHCLNNFVRYIQYGNMSIPLIYTPSKSVVFKIIKHPRYIEAMNLNDIGLLLVSPVLMSKYGSLSAIDYKTLSGLSVEYAGYGQTFMEDHNTKIKLIEFLLDMYRPLQIGQAIVSTCDGEDLGQNLICLAPKCSLKQTVLPGDSGGPLLYDNKVVAIACAITLDYSLQSFTPISPHLIWIYNTMATVTPSS